ncbi:hypothetical protein BDN72DRAFT_833502 [Pluteus cervinus]|uniref:Uncharacterized protein n=1 Tax=Pluteus cervinus TaxID=181527 RepID=A0ACD3B9X1_9AGAR|nr:hypothetical protein BDN72DRAFT_833502 [Pluteus cervinus]
MADSFADLWNSTTPSKQNQAQTPKLGSSTQPQKRPQYDAFSILSATSASGSRSLTPSQPSHSQRALSKTPTAAKPDSTGFDAFSDLLGPGLSGSNSNLTIAQRAAKVEQERQSKVLAQKSSASAQSSQSSSSAWAGLDSLGSGLSSFAGASAANGSTVSALKSQPATKVKQPSSLVQDDDDWGLGDFGSSTTSPSISQPEPTATQKPRGSLWDLGEFNTEPSTRRAATPKEPQRSSTPGDFDFGNREDGLLNGQDSDDEGDILGDLGKPVEAVRRQPPTAQHSPSPNASSQRQSSRTVSPPPHILGQLIEMGFSVQQARVALAATDTGLDVQAALEMLLANGAAGPEPLRTSSPPSPPEQRPPRTKPRPRPQRAGSTTTRDQTPDSEVNIQAQADKILAQASEIGFNMFNRANALWRDGKEKVAKVYEERTTTRSSNGTPNPGKPRWMQEAVEVEDEGWKDTGGFQDDAPPEPGVSSPPAAAPKPRRKDTVEPTRPVEPSVDLFSSEPVAYVSPFRRGKPKPSSTPPRPPGPSQSARAPSPIKLAARSNVISASQSSIARSIKHKTLGGEKFKLGQYAESESAYSSAVACLPDGHLLLVPLYNNRALTRLKTGDYPGAIEDATKVVELIGVGYHPARELKVEKEEEGSGVDLGDGLIKAWKRRAEAWEGREKWMEAGRDWESVAGADWAKGNLRSEAVRGVGRCRRMVSAGENGARETRSTAPPKPPVAKKSTLPPRRATTNLAPSQALKNLRQANNAAEAEDQARHELKDVVDQKLIAWKGGKETNLRALLASLETVLWPELGLPKLSMADLVTPSQVKIKYTRTIAKLHPDKLSVTNTTVEQRMVANGVFGTLNEAWNAFKQ